MSAPSEPSEVFAKNVHTTRDVSKAIQAAAMDSDAMAAAAHAEEIVAWLQSQWGERGFTPEQCVFALALTTINFREGVPAQHGGKEMFDRVAYEAQKYVNDNR